MAVEADTLGWQEEKSARAQAETRGIPADERARRFARPEVRSVQAGGAETRPELELQQNNKHWQLSDNLERALVNLLSEALRHSIFERDAYSS